ncbi:MAG: hypothetical protein AB8H12_14690 [Lewinella sp.]
MKAYFAPAFNQAYGRAVAAGKRLDIIRMNKWTVGLTGIREAELYEDAYRLLDGRIDKVNNVLSAYLRNAASPEAQSKATKAAGLAAGFEQVSLLQEPIAASLAFANQTGANVLTDGRQTSSMPALPEKWKD